MHSKMIKFNDKEGDVIKKYNCLYFKNHMYNSKSFLSLFKKKLINEELLENSGLLCKLKLR